MAETPIWLDQFNATGCCIPLFVFLQSLVKVIRSQITFLPKAQSFEYMKIGFPWTKNDFILSVLIYLFSMLSCTIFSFWWGFVVKVLFRNISIVFIFLSVFCVWVFEYLLKLQIYFQKIEMHQKLLNGIFEHPNWT